MFIENLPVIIRVKYLQYTSNIVIDGSFLVKSLRVF